MPRAWTAPAALFILYAGLFSFLTLRRHATFHTTAYDLGLHHQALWNTSQGRLFEYTVVSGEFPRLKGLLGDHVNLILLFLAPLAWIFPGAETLLVVQTLILASAVFPLFGLGRRAFGRDGPALVFAALSLLHPAIQAANLFDFHAVPLGAVFLIWAWWFAETGSAAGLGISIGLALSTQENVALAVALFGLAQLFRGRRRSGLAILASGVVWFAICFYVVLPEFNPGVGSNALWRYAEWGRTPFGIVRGWMARPEAVARRLLGWYGREYAASILAPLAFLGLLSPLALLFGASEWALNRLSSVAPQHTIDFQYAAVVTAAASVAAIEGGARLAALLSRRLRRPGFSAWLVAGVALVSTASFQAARYGTLRAFGPAYRESYVLTAHHRLASRFLRQIPAGASVSAQNAILPHLSDRRRIFLFPHVFGAEYVLVDTTLEVSPSELFRIPGFDPRASDREHVRRLLADRRYHIVDSEDGWILLSRLDRPTSSESGGS